MVLSSALFEGAKQPNMNATENITGTSFIKSCTLLKESYEVFIEFPSTFYKNAYLVLSGVTLALVVPTIVLNGTAVIAILKCSQLYSKVCFFVVLIQSVIDLMVGVLGLPLLAAILLTNALGTHISCVFILLAEKLMVLPSSFSIHTLTALTLERYIGLMHPYFYERFVTKRRMLQYFLFTGISTLMCSPISLQYVQVNSTVGTALIFSFICLSILAYARIFVAARKLSRTNVVAGYGDGQQNRAKNLSKRGQFLKDVKLAKSCFLVVICFLLCYLPVALFYLCSDHVEGSADQLVIRLAFIILMMFNSTLNSLILVWGKPLLRREIYWRSSD